MNVRIGQSLTISCKVPVPPGSDVIHVWNFQNATRLPVKSMKRLTELSNGQVLFFSNILSKDDKLQIMCQAKSSKSLFNFIPLQERMAYLYHTIMSTNQLILFEQIIDWLKMIMWNK